MQKEKCTKCKEIKSEHCFHKDNRSKSGLTSHCKSCRNLHHKGNKERISKQRKLYRERNREKISKQKKIYRERNKEKLKKELKLYRERNKEKISSYRKKYCEENRQEINKKRNVYSKNRYTKDPIFRTKIILRSQITRLHEYKEGKTIKTVGCSARKFWKMNGSPSIEEMKNLHIDHIIPLSWFDLTNEDHVKVSSHYTNLQYLSSKDNLDKSNRYAGSPNNIIAYKGDFDIEAYVNKKIKAINDQDVVVVL